MRLLCRIFGHLYEYTDEYANNEGHVQADKICLRCGHIEMAWTGPSVEEIEEACDTIVPTKKEAYDEVLL
ncbi:DUF1660 [Haloarcula virus HCTV-16]|nr:DUF1660 [Haloarcula virus HCTV-16]